MRRKKIQRGCILLLILHLTAVYIGHMQANNGNLYYNFLYIVRASIYMAIFTAWGFSVRYRLNAVLIRKYLTCETALMVVWMLLRMVKHNFTSSVVIGRYLWYLYYVPMLMIPLVAVFASLSLGRQKDFRLPYWAHGLTAMTIIAQMVVLTNDLHQKVFIFPEGAKVFSDSKYSYGAGYYAIVVCEAVCILLAFGIMLYRCRVPKRRRVLLLPLLPIIAAVGYLAAYTMQAPFIKKYAYDMTVSVCCLVIATYECCIANGLIQTNLYYGELFEAALFPVCITDLKQHPSIFSRKGRKLAERLQHGEIAPEDTERKRTRLKHSDIRGGCVYWEEDVSAIMEDIAELQDIRESLEESHAIQVEELRVNQEKTRLEEANHLYTQMQEQTAGQLRKMEDLLERFSETDDPTEEKQVLAELMVYAAYFKRRNNLLFISEIQQKIRGAELRYCLRESLSALERTGVSCSYEAEIRGFFALEDITILYDRFESVVEQTLGKLLALAVIVRKEGDCFALYMNLSLKNAEELQFSEGFETEHEDEDAYLLSFYLKQKGGGSDDEV
ncbi:MAG: hypothetical protein Q4B01_09025 [Eubacteriales bacterium]|nr:hypothetical protein [Eubacteriales bacterium]